MTVTAQDLYLGRGDNAPAPTWSFDFVPSGTWELIATAKGTTFTARSDDGTLAVDLAARTVTWPITSAQSMVLPLGRLTTYTLRRFVPGGEVRFYAGGAIVILNGPVPASLSGVQVAVAGPQGPGAVQAILTGVRPPYDSEGIDGQFWIDVGGVPAIYGPKIDGAWPLFGYQLGSLTSRQSLDFSDSRNSEFTNQ